MLTLDFMTNNPRWGKRGIIFSNLCEYAKTLGFLSNIRHYKGCGDNSKYFNNSISIHAEYIIIRTRIILRNFCQIYTKLQVQDLERI